MQSRVYVTVGRPSVCPSIQLPHATVAGLLLWDCQAGSVDQCCTAGAWQLATLQHGMQQQMRAVPRCQLM